MTSGTGISSSRFQKWKVPNPNRHGHGPEIIFFVKPSIGTHKKDEKSLLGSLNG
ncbi:hypothetical protein D3C84_410340 [compost metagenome]